MPRFLFIFETWEGQDAEFMLCEHLKVQMQDFPPIVHPLQSPLYPIDLNASPPSPHLLFSNSSLSPGQENVNPQLEILSKLSGLSSSSKAPLVSVATVVTNKV